jgi:hypothetical protein
MADFIPASRKSPFCSAVSFGRQPNALAKHPTEGSQTLKTHGQTHIGYWLFSLQQQCLRLSEANSGQVLMWGFVKSLLECSQEMIGRKAGHLSHVNQRYRLIEASCGVVPGSMKPAIKLFTASCAQGRKRVYLLAHMRVSEQ